MDIRKTSTGIQHNFTWNELESQLRNLDIELRPDVQVYFLDENDNALGYIIGSAGNTRRIAVTYFSEAEGRMCMVSDASQTSSIPVIAGGIIDHDADPDAIVPVDMAVQAFRTFFEHQTADDDLVWVCTDWR
ncbi:MAG: hypothetical protein AAF787_02610 [Chloroflexota bacterium]